MLLILENFKHMAKDLIMVLLVNLEDFAHIVIGHNTPLKFVTINRVILVVLGNKMFLQMCLAVIMERHSSILLLLKMHQQGIHPIFIKISTIKS